MAVMPSEHCRCRGGDCGPSKTQRGNPVAESDLG